MKSYQEFFAELKRRKVFRVAGIYGIVSFGVLQAADLMLPRLGVPDWTVTFMVALVVLAFPVALILAWAFEVTPDGVRRTGEAGAGEIERIMAQPLSKRWPAGLLALVGVASLVLGAWWVGKQSSGSAVPVRTGAVHLAMADPTQDPRPSIAVLPFVNMSSDPDQEYFSDGMTEEILNTLANIGELRVSGRTSAFAYKDRSVDLRQIGTELGVRYLIEGSVRKAGDRLRITAQLIDATDGSHLWSDQYDRRLEDVFAIQTEIAEAIADALTVPLGLEPDEELVSPTGDLAAYDLYLAGRRLMRERGSSLVEAMRLFRAAVGRDSSWAPAWAALAEATEISIWYAETYDDSENSDLETQARLDAAEWAANRALELDPRSASALVALGSVYRDRGAWRESEDTYERAIALDADNAEAHQQYGELLGNMGRIAESVRALDRAVALDPAGVRLDNLAFSLERDGRRVEAVEVYNVGLERDSETSFGSFWYGAASTNAKAGHVDRATEILTRGIREMGLANWMAWTGGTTATEAELRQLMEGIAERNVDLVPEKLRTLLYPEHWAAMGDLEAAARSVTGSRLQTPWIPDIWQPELDSLRSLPAFREILANAGLSNATLQRTPESDRTRPLILRGTSSP